MIEALATIGILAIGIFTDISLIYAVAIYHDHCYRDQQFKECLTEREQENG